MERSNNRPDSIKLITLAIFSVLFFMWGLLTLLNIVLSDHLVHIFNVDYSLSTLMNLTFFGSYLVVSIPAGKLINTIGYKKGILAGWIAATAGCFLFNAAVLSKSYYLFLFALFILASGITILQVGANLYVLLLGNRGNAASRLNFVQAFNAIGTVVAPFLAAAFLRKMVAHIPDESYKVLDQVARIELVSKYVHLPYLFLGTLMAIFAFFLRKVKIPDINNKTEEPTNKITSLRRRHVMHFPQLRLGAFAIFAYVGAEVALGTYLGDSLHGKVYWGLAVVGRLIGAFALIKVSPHKAVGFAASSAILLVLVCVLTEGKVSIWAVTLVGLFNSILFPTIFALGVNGLGKFSNEGASVLVMFIVGGAVLPFMVKNFAYVNYHFAFIIPIICYFYITLYGLKLSRFEKEHLLVKQDHEMLLDTNIKKLQKENPSAV